MNLLPSYVTFNYESLCDTLDIIGEQKNEVAFKQVLHHYVNKNKRMPWYLVLEYYPTIDMIKDLLQYQTLHLFNEIVKRGLNYLIPITIQQIREQGNKVSIEPFMESVIKEYPDVFLIEEHFSNCSIRNHLQDFSPAFICWVYAHFQYTDNIMTCLTHVYHRGLPYKTGEEAVNHYIDIFNHLFHNHRKQFITYAQVMKQRMIRERKHWKKQSFRRLHTFLSKCNNI